MLFIEFVFEVGPEENNVIFFHIGGVLEAKLQSLDFIGIEFEKSGKKVAHLSIIADSAAPHF